MRKRQHKFNSLLWEMETSSGVESSYLFGTIHLRDPRVFNQVDALKLYLNTCDVFLAEVDLDEMESLDWTDLPALRGDGFYRHIGNRRMNKSRKIFLKSFGVDLMIYRNIHPFFLVNQITDATVVNPEPLSLDHYLWQYARERKIETDGVEKVSEQIEILGRLDPDDQVRSLLAISGNVSNFRRTLNKMIGYYTDQDLRMIYKASRRTLGKYKGIHLRERNLKMADRIASRIKVQPHFIAVGAAHFFGNFGLLKLLKQSGCRVRPVRL